MPVDIDWSTLPERFDYVRQCATEYHEWLVQNRYNDRHALDSLSAAHLESLARLYEEIDARGDANSISLWLSGLPHEQKRNSRGVYWPVFRLFSVFEQLKDRGVPPFDSGAVRYWEPDPEFDWSKLPKALRYLGEIAEKFGGYHGDDDVEKLTESELSDLAAASEKIRIRKDAPAIFAWFKAYGLDHPEAAWLATTISLMEQADVPIED